MTKCRSMDDLYVRQLPKYRKDDLQHTEKNIDFAIGKRLARASYLKSIF